MQFKFTRTARRQTSTSHRNPCSLCWNCSVSSTAKNHLTMNSWKPPGINRGKRDPTKRRHGRMQVLLRKSLNPCLRRPLKLSMHLFVVLEDSMQQTKHTRLLKKREDKTYFSIQILIIISSKQFLFFEDQETRGGS